LSCLHSHRFEYVAAPIAISPLQQLHNQAVYGYADVLARCGFANARTLLQMNQAWQSMLRLVQPDIVVCKYAPLAEFATRICPVLAIGTGFELPPLTTPLPRYVEPQNAPVGGSSSTESQILQAMQVVAQTSGCVEPATVAQAFGHVSRICLSDPALDHFGARSDLEYLGPVEEMPPTHALGSVLPTAWLTAGQSISFLYLRLGEAWLREFLDLVRIRFPLRRWLVVDPTISERQCHAFSTDHARVLNAPVDWAYGNGISSTVPFDSVICHGGHGCITQALALGLRLLVLPQHTEQLLLARRAVASQVLGAGMMAVGPSVSLPNLMQAIDLLLQAPAPVAPFREGCAGGPSALTTLVQRIEATAQQGLPVQAPHDV